MIRNLDYWRQIATSIFWAYWNRKKWNHLVIHKNYFTELIPSFLALPLLCGHVRKMFNCPHEMTIVLIHNRENEPIMVKSLRYVGIENFVVLRPKIERAWHNTVKILVMYDYLNSDSCNTEYIFFCDSDDAVLRDHPEKAIKYIEEQNCDLLYSNTKFAGGYESMPRVKAWADQIARENGYKNLYINTGVWIGRTAFMRQVFKAALTYITKQDLSREEYKHLRSEGTLCKKLHRFPKGVGSDQVILRYLHPRFYPRMKIDYAGKLALR